MSRYLAYVSPAVGHVLPLVPGLLELSARGHQVHIRTLPSLVDTLREGSVRMWTRWPLAESSRSPGTSGSTWPTAGET